MTFLWGVGAFIFTLTAAILLLCLVNGYREFKRTQDGRPGLDDVPWSGVLTLLGATALAALCWYMVAA